MNRYFPLKTIRRWIPTWTTPELICSALSALLLVVVFPPFGLPYLLHTFALVPALLVLRERDWRQALRVGWLTGVLYHLVLLYWLYLVTLPGMILLCVYIAFWFALPFVAVSWVGARWYTPLVFAGVWYLQEQARAFGWMSFRWGYLGHGSHDADLLRPVVSLIGVEGLSFLVAFTNIILAGMAAYGLKDRFRFSINHWSPPWTLQYGLVAILLFASAYGFGYLQNMQPANGTLHSPDRPVVALIQGGWPPGGTPAPDHEEVLDIYLTLSEESLTERDQPVELIVWPESTITIPLNHWSEGRERIRDFVTQHDVSILIGCVHGEYHGNDEWSFFNRAWFFTPEATRSEAFNLEGIPFYDKMHLVPYGEWIPLGEYWPFYYIETLIEEAGAGIFERGRSIPVFSLPDSEYRFAVAICFESTLTWHAMEAKRKGADFLVVITNDAWFVNSPGLEQHFLQSRFRAVETGLPIVRVSNTGITAFLDSLGRTTHHPSDRRLAETGPGVLVHEVDIRRQ